MMGYDLPGDVIQPVGSATTPESLELLRRKSRFAVGATLSSVWTAGEQLGNRPVH